MKRWYWLVAVALIISGCGGNTAGQPARIVPGYYRGTFEFNSTAWPSGSAPIVVDVQENGDLGADAFSSSYSASVTKWGHNATIVLNGAVVTGTSRLVSVGGGLRLTVDGGHDFQATATFTPHPLPELGSLTIIPPAGTYSGEFLVVSNGRVKSLGLVTATVDATGQWWAIANGTNSFGSDGVYTGRFQVDGTLTNAALVHDGSVMSQTPKFSFDGTKLVAEYDQLPLQPASCWLELTID